MKRFLLVFAFLVISYGTKAQETIQFLDNGGCISLGTPITFNLSGNNAGRNEYTFAESGYEVYVKFVTDHWEIFDIDGVILYRNNNQTTPNPPSLSYGGWTKSGGWPCALAGFSGTGTTNSSTTSVSSINRAGATPTNVGSVSFTVTFAASVTGVDASDFTLTKTGTADGTVGTPTGSGTTWTVPVTGISGDGILRLDFTGTTGVTPNVSGSFTSGQTYTIDSTAPTVSSVSVPSNGTYIATANLNFTVNFPENITVNTAGGTPQLALTIGSTSKSAVYLSGSGTSALVFRYTVSSGDADTDGIVVNSLSANGGTLRDAAGNDANVTLYSVGATTSIFVDGVVPTVTGVTSSNANGTYKKDDIISIQVNFSEIVNVTGTPELYLNLSPTPAFYNSGSGTSSLTFNYTVEDGKSTGDLDYYATVSLVAGTISDVNGNAANRALPAPGTTGSLAANKDIVIDAIVPTISGVTASTANGSYKAGDAISIQVNFSEAVTVTGTPQLTLETGTTDQAVNYASGSGTSTLTFTYTVQAGDTSSDLDYTSTAALALNGGTIKDAAGNNATLTLATPGAANSLRANKNIVVDTAVPTVSGVISSTANGSYKAGDAISIQVIFSEPVTVTGTPQLTLETGTTDQAVNYASGNGTSTLTFTYNVQAGDTSSDLDYTSTTALALNGGTIKDAAGNNATLTLATPGAANSLGANKNIVIDGIAPTVSGVTASTANGSYKAGDAISIQVNFSEAVTVTGTPQLTLETGTTDQAVNYASGSGTSTLTFTYTVQAGDTSSDLDYISTTALALNSGTIKDAAGNNATLTLATPGAANSLGANKNIVIDGIAPTVSGVTASTANGSYKAGDAISIQVNFSEPVTVTGTPQLTLETGTTDQAVNYASGSGTSTLTFTYTVQAGDTSSDLDYTSTSALALNSGTIKDAAGNNATLTLATPGAANSLGANKNIVVDSTLPTVSGVTASTANGSYKAGDAISIQVIFSEPVTVTGTPQLTLETGTTDQAVNYASGSGTSTLTFTYTVQAGDTSSDLDYISTSALALNSGTIKDAAGNNATLTLATPGAANSLGANKNIVVDSTSPTVSGVTASTANGSYKAGDAISIQVNFSEAVTVTGTPQLTLETGTTDQAVNYASGSGTSTLTFTYTVQAGDTSSDLDYISTTALALNSGTIKDAAGNNATLTLATPGAANSLGANKNIVVDSTSPTVSGITASTANGSYKAGDAISIQVIFSEAVIVTGTPQLTLETGTTDRAVNYASGSGTSTLTFTYTIQAGDVSSDLDYISTTALALNSGTIKDAAGNNATLTLATPGAANSLGANKDFVIDTQSPAAPVAITPANGSFTSDNTPTYSGTAEPSSTLTIVVDGMTAGTTSADGAGSWSFTPVIALAEGPHSINATATDGAGNTSTNSNTNTFTVDTSAPSAPVAIAPANGSITADNTPVYTGVAEPSTTITIVIDGSPVATTTANGDGNWSFTQVTPLTDGSHTVRATAADAAGNTSVSSNTNTFTVDAGAPTLTSVAISSNNAISNLAKPGDEVTIIFTASEPILVPAVSISGQTATVANTSGNIYTGKYTTTTAGTEGLIAFNIIFTDAAGNSGTAVTSTTNASSVTFDKTAPSTPAGLSSTAGSSQILLTWPANSEGDLKSYKVYGGTNANPTTLLGTVTPPEVSYTHTGLTNGTTYYYRISATDNAGNESTLTADVNNVPKASQIITFNPFPAATYGDADFDAGATVNSALAVSYSSNNTSVATIVAGKIRITGVGTATITASQAGDAAHTAAADKTQTLVVNKKSITVTLNTSPAITKVYDGAVTAVLAAGNYTLNGIVGSDAVTVSGTVAYDNKNAGSGKIVTANTFVLAGAQKDNYSLSTTTATTTGTITAKPVTLALNASPVITKVYDGTTAATLAAGNYTLNGLEIGDVVTVSGTAAYDNKDAGTGKTVTANTFVLAGAQKDNYNLSTTTATTTGAITAKPIILTLNASPAITKVYDNTVTATLVAGNYSLSGLETGDVVTVSGTAAFDNQNAATGKTVTASSFVLAGAQKDNYSLSTTTAATTGAITAKPITLALNASPAITKVYDGTSAATLAAGNYNLNGLETGDVVTVSGTAAFDNKDAGTGKTVTASAFVLAGAQKDNYSLSTSTAATTGSINKKTLTVIADNKTKVQGTENPAFTITYTGFAGGENQSAITTTPLAVSTATLLSPVGTYPITVSGGTASNYTFNYSAGTLTVTPGAPTNITLAAAAIYENQAPGVSAGTLSSVSENPDATFTYSLVSGTGSADNSLFTISGNTIRTAAALDFEQQPSYSIRVRSTTQHGLSLEKQFTIAVGDVNEAPTLAAISNQTMCFTTAQQAISLSGISAGPEASQTTQLTVNSTNADLFDQLSINGNTLNYRIKAGQSGLATVTVTVSDNGGTDNGGTDTYSRSFNLVVNPVPLVTISTNKGTTELSKGDVLVLTATGGNTYSWVNSPGILSGQNTANLTIRPEQTTTYRVRVTSATNCITEQEITVNVMADYLTINSTNLISPNGDGKNDNFIIKNIDMYPNNEVKIYDRAGRLIYSKVNYTDEWNGTFQGSPLAEDTYYYIVDFGNGKPKIKGFITIVRD